MKRYLVLSEDCALEVPPVYVMADTAEQAIRRYCREVQSKEPSMKDFVQGKSIDGFLATILFSYEQRFKTPEGKGLPGPPFETVRKKVLEYFSDRPDLGNLYVRYLEGNDPEILTEAVYEFISERDTTGFDAFEDSTIQTLR
ncbi:hypothetical protein [Telluria aromaticivorans]|uniref:Uncharacterized protein n=1 Tax=Telluria aromaticivorans TaxID=2725995 RepID=A0A7Y2K2L7_9BURK|nr:hypothetical protein [Telluria aromaticivorans]NNG25532.1 hypothetical protein [Telluria aromaticivorans]